MCVCVRVCVDTPEFPQVFYGPPKSFFEFKQKLEHFLPNMLSMHGVLLMKHKHHDLNPINIIWKTRKEIN